MSAGAVGIPHKTCRGLRGDANSILVKRNWFVQANIRVVPGADDTEIIVGSAANFTPTGHLLNSTTIVLKVPPILKTAFPDSPGEW